MAKLSPKDPQFGIPVASRIDGDTAIRFNKEAGKAGKSLSLYIAEFIKKALATEKEIIELTSQLSKEKAKSAAAEKRTKELESQLIKEKETAKRTAGRFIVEISEGDKKQASELIQTYNKILTNEKSK